MDKLAVGREFADFERLSAAVATFENGHFVQFYKRDGRKIEAVVHRNTRKTYNTFIVCYPGIYDCIRDNGIIRDDSDAKKRTTQ